MAFEMPPESVLADPEAAGIYLPFHLSWLALHDRAHLEAADTVLIHAAAGGVGTAALQLAVEAGARVIATAGSADKLELCRSLGADVAIDYTQPGWPDQVRAAAPGGVQLALEAVGGDVLQQAIALLAPRGRAVVFGASAGQLGSVPVRSLFMLKSVTGFSLLASRSIDEPQARADIAELTQLLADGELRAATTTLPLADIARAHRLLEDRAVPGRIVLVP